MEKSLSDTITLIAINDGTKFITKTHILRRSNLISGMIELFKGENEIEIPEVKSSILRDILEYLDHYIDHDPPAIPSPLPKYSIAQVVGHWEESFINKYSSNINSLFDMINAATYLDIPSLVDLSCAKAAIIVKDYDKQQFMKTLNIQEDLTEDEAKALEEQLIKEKKTQRENLMKDKFKK